ncbi:hypothetical protein ACHQM5_017157 [Ranunculus cassubicifolius]
MEESVAAEDSIILVGHSYAGIGISMAMESFPEKIFVSIFITAAMPGPTLSLADIGKEILICILAAKMAAKMVLYMHAQVKS